MAFTTARALTACLPLLVPSLACGTSSADGVQQNAGETIDTDDQAEGTLSTNTPSESAPTRLCATCTPDSTNDQTPAAGGDTSDLGGGVPPCTGTVEGTESVSLARAVELGFDPDEALAGLEGRYQTPIRWGEDADSETVLTVQMERTDRATIVRWGAGTCHDSDYLLVDTEVRLSTADGSVEGSMVVPAGPGRYGRHTVVYESLWGDEPTTSFFITGDASNFVGTIDVGTPHEDNPTLEAQLRLYLHEDYGLRARLALSLFHRRPPPIPPLESPKTLDHQVVALPPDGCQPFQVRSEEVADQCVHTGDLERTLADAGM